MDWEQQTIKNTEDIGKLTGIVDKLATSFGYESDRSKESREGVKEMVQQLRALNEKITSLANLQAQIADLAEKSSKQEKDTATLKESINTLLLMKEKLDDSREEIVEMRTQLTVFKEWKDKHDGAVAVVDKGATWFWRIFGNGITAMITAALVWYFGDRGTYTKTSTSIERQGVVTGE